MPMPFAPSRPSQLSPKLSRYNVYAIPAGFSGCAFWRYRLPLNKLKKIGTHLNINITNQPNKTLRMEDIQSQVATSDLISIQSPGYKDAFTLMKLYKSEGKKVVVDYDDYSFDLSPGNPRYAELGTKEVEVLDGAGQIIWSWKDGQNGFDLKANIAKYEAFVACLKTADLITTTTDYLAEKFRRHNPSVAICPNSIDFDLWKPLPRPPSDQVRIGWFGGDSHYIDLKVFKGLFLRLVAKYPQVKIVMQAPPVPEWAEFFKDIPTDRMEWYGWSDLRYYTLFLASRYFDIGLCPLEQNNEFNLCKSNIKALEFQALGAAVVAQKMIPYANTIEDGITGYLAEDEDEWFEKISFLIDNPKARNLIAMAGHLDARDKWNLDKNARLWEKAYTDLLER